MNTQFSEMECPPIEEQQQFAEMFEQLKEFTEKNGGLPSIYSENLEEQRLGNWMQGLTKYGIRPPSPSPEDIWKATFEKVKAYTARTGKMPSVASKNPETRRLGKWLKEEKKKVEENPDFLLTLPTPEEVWNTTMDEVKRYTEENGKLPSAYSKDPETRRLGKWVKQQKKNFLLNYKITNHKSQINAQKQHGFFWSTHLQFSIS